MNSEENKGPIVVIVVFVLIILAFLTVCVLSDFVRIIPDIKAGKDDIKVEITDDEKD